MTRIPRKLIPDDQCIVVLDTCSVRNIADDPESVPLAWVATFAKMAKAGYSFSLADNAFTELLNQHLHGSLPEAKLHTIVAALAQFLNPDVPVLPGKRDLLGIIGELNDSSWSESEVAAFSKRAWAVLNDPALLTEDQRNGVKAALQDDRDDWREAFKTFDDAHAAWLARNPNGEAKQPLDEYKHPALDAALDIIASSGKSQSPTMAERQDLEMRYIWRQWVRTRKTKEPYNPGSSNHLNDGIDFDLYRYLMLPAFVVSDDNGFHSKIADIKSPQRTWFKKPEELAAAWERGELSCPTWRAEGSDSTK